MAKYIVKRVAMGIFSVFIVATLTFFIMNLVPGGPFVETSCSWDLLEREVRSQDEDDLIPRLRAV